MAHILIDGYNLIGIAHGNLQKAREDIIKTLQEYAQFKNHDITIVFDGWKSGQKEQTRIKSRHVTVIYSRLGENADTVIKKMLTAANKAWIVVSSDREVADFAFKKDYAAVHSEEFEFKVHSTLRNLQREINENDISLEDELDKYYEDETANLPPPSSKGNPRKMSKKQKKKMQALKKL